MKESVAPEAPILMTATGPLVTPGNLLNEGGPSRAAAASFCIPWAAVLLLRLPVQGQIPGAGQHSGRLWSGGAAQEATSVP